MKILLVNKFHNVKGGSETYYFGLGEMLKKAGHEVIYFSMKDEKNVPCEQEKFFVENVDFNAPMGKLGLVKASLKMLYSFEAKAKFDKLLTAEKPDIIHLNIFQSQLTGSIVDVAKKHKIPIVYTAHDLKSVCPNYQMMDNGKICEKCLGGKYVNCFKSGCMKNSKLKSLLATMEAYVYKFKKTYEKIDLVITPSAFYKKKIDEAGVMKCPVIHMANFLPEGTEYSVSEIGSYILYFGRLSHEKGTMTLLKAYEKANADKPLYYVGTGPIKEQLEKYIDEHNLSDKVKLLGFKSGDELKTLVKESLCVVLPSEWYENGPYSIMEAMAVGKPVIVSDLGGLPEMVEDGINGYVVKPFDTDSLSEAIVKLSNSSRDELVQMGIRSLEKAESTFDAAMYLKRIETEYSGVLSVEK
ncbi:MAG: glycosyltransferase family 4 protein [Clostridia bacterium]|nr:glycosyltransferase family 4 protein [Clostridia bacterium]